MAVKYRYFKGKRVSVAQYYIFMECERRLANRGGVPLNSGHRSMSEQAALVRRKGLYNATTNPHGAAWPNRNAPHIWVGRANHAVDIDQFAGAGIDAVLTTIRTMCAQANIPFGWRKTVSTEPWHVQELNEANVIALGRAYKRKPTILDRLRHSPLRPGSRSPDVIAIQKWLSRAPRGAKWKYTGRIAKNIGTQGPHLTRLVKEFQKHVGLKVDGIVGPKTAAAMRRRYGWKAIQRKKKGAHK